MYLHTVSIANKNFRMICNIIAKKSNNHCENPDNKKIKNLNSKKGAPRSIHSTK
jgi:hypothetical protein